MEKDLPRLQKTLAAAGVASRRACEALIAEGRVTVNGKVVREMGAKPDPDKDDIRVDGQPIRKQETRKPLYIMLNKPIGYTSTVSDPHAERTVLELLLQIEERIYPVGRLDVDSEGMLLLTNDGEFANRLTHPRYHVPKLYRVRARGFVGREAATRLAEGVELEDGKTAPAEVRFIEYDTASQSTIIEVTLYEGRNRQVRRMFDQVGHPVRQLTRIGFGTLRLQALNPGTWRKLRPEEVDALLALALPTATPPKSARRPKSSAPYRPRNAGREEGERGRRGEGETEAGNREQGTGNRKEEPVNTPIAAPAARFTSATKPGFSEQPAFGARPAFAGKNAPISRPVPADVPASSGRPEYGTRPAPNGKPKYGAKPAYGGRPDAANQPAHNGRPAAGGKPAYGAKHENTPVANPAFAVGNPRYANPLNNPLLKARPAKFKPSRPAPNAEQTPAASSNQQPKFAGPKPKTEKRQSAIGNQQSAIENRKSKIENPKGAVDFSSNSAAGRKAGLPFQPRPKQGHRAFGRAKP